MSRKRHTAEQSIRNLREAEVELAKGQTTAEVVVKAGANAAFPIASTAGVTAGGGRKKVVSTRPFSLQAGAVSSTTTLAPARTTQGVSAPAAVLGAMATSSQSAVSALGASPAQGR